MALLIGVEIEETEKGLELSASPSPGPKLCVTDDSCSTEGVVVDSKFTMFKFVDATCEVVGNAVAVFLDEKLSLHDDCSSGSIESM